jgi:hypothetical protein
MNDKNAAFHNYRALRGRVVEGGMTKKKTAKPAASISAKADDASGRRSRVKLAALALAPLLLAGGGYAGWTVYAAPRPGEGAPDAMKVAAIPPEVAAESSFTQAFALSVLIAPDCGMARVPALRTASDAEAHADGNLVNLSWLAAARRVAATTEISCDYLRAEVRRAEFRAAELEKAKDAAPKNEH